MRFQCGSLLIVLFLASLSPGGEKAIEVGPKGWEFTGEIKADDPKLTMDFMGKTFLMPAKQFNVKLEAGYRYRFTLDTESTKLDPFLALKDSKGEVLTFDDDGGGKLNSKLTFSPFDPKGAIQVFAASLHGQPGSVALNISVIAKYSVDPGEYEVKKEPLRLKGELTTDRQEVHFKVRLEAGKTYRIDMTANKLDSFLELRDQAGRLVAEDDDSGGKLDARITKNIAREGLYRIVASSTNFAQTGPFVLEVREE